MDNRQLDANLPVQDLPLLGLLIEHGSRASGDRISWMIEIAAVLSGVLRHWEDLAVILAMLFINAGVGFSQEFKADNAIARF